MSSEQLSSEHFADVILGSLFGELLAAGSLRAPIVHPLLKASLARASMAQAWRKHGAGIMEHGAVFPAPLVTESRHIHLSQFLQKNQLKRLLLKKVPEQKRVEIETCSTSSSSSMYP